MSYRLVSHNVAKGAVLPKLGRAPMREAAEQLGAHYEQGGAKVNS